MQPRCPAFPAQWFERLMSCSPRGAICSCPRRLPAFRCGCPVGPTASPKDLASETRDAGTTRFCRTRHPAPPKRLCRAWAFGSSARHLIAHRDDPPCNHRRTDASRPPPPPQIVTIAFRPSDGVSWRRSYTISEFCKEEFFGATEFLTQSGPGQDFIQLPLSPRGLPLTQPLSARAKLVADPHPPSPRLRRPKARRESTAFTTPSPNHIPSRRD